MNTLASKITSASYILSSAAKVNVLSTINRNLGTAKSKRIPINQRWPYWVHKWDGPKTEHYGFTYYPRYPNEIDPEWEKTPLFMVQRVRNYKGNPFWEKQIMRELKIDRLRSQIAIVMNTEVQNKKLWLIKHLIKITPITFPDGVPTQEDIPYCRLYENGELRIHKTLNADQQSLKATEDQHKFPKYPNGHCVRTECWKRWRVPFENNVLI